MPVTLTQFTIRALALLVMCLSVATAQAKHIVGGEITYECLGDGAAGQRRYRITVNIYRDCNGGGAAFDGALESFTDFEMSIYRGSTFVRGVGIPRSGLRVTTLDPESANPCFVFRPGICVEKGTYVTEISLPISTETYTVSYQRCCRNETISNIVRPGDAGVTYLVEITPEAQETCNSTPAFNQFPPLVICADSELEFDASASDAQGDRLVYSLCEPYYGGGTEGLRGGNANSFNGLAPQPESPPPYTPVVFRPEFTPQSPLDGTISLDPETGFLRVNPMTLGQYVVCVSVEEWRDGRKIGEVRRDFQFNVIACDPRVEARVAAVVDAKAFVPDTIQVCGALDLALADRSLGQEFIQEIEWTIPGTTNGTLVSGERLLQLGFEEYGRYPAQLVVNPGLVCADTADFTIVLVPPAISSFEFAYDTCVVGPVDFVSTSRSLGGLTINSYVWEFGDGTSSDEADPSHLYRTAGRKLVKHTITDDAGCVKDTSGIIDYFPLPLELPIDLIAEAPCAPASVPFRFGTELITDEYDILWDFGDGTTSTEVAPDHYYERPGIYNIAVSIVSPIGCSQDTQLVNTLAVLESPLAGFEMAPDDVDTRDAEVFFTDRSLEAVSWQWAFDSLGSSREINPSFVFPDSGAYEIELIVSHLSGCLDTAVQQLRISPFQSLYLPNALIPNSDGLNERFRPTGYLRYVTEFDLQIFNRWGERIYRTGNPEAGWDGTNERNGELATPGVYLYVITHSGITGPQRLEGTVTVVQ